MSLKRSHLKNRERFIVDLNSSFFLLQIFKMYVKEDRLLAKQFFNQTATLQLEHREMHLKE